MTDAAVRDDENPDADQSTPFGSALSWAYVQTIGRMVASLGVSLLLARLLGPEAFGVLAMATVYVFFIDMIMRQGLVSSIVQRPTLTRAHLDTAFWMVLGASAVLLPASIGLSGWWASVNRLPELQPVIVGLSFVLPIKALSVVQEARIQRLMDYRLLAIRTNIAVLAGGLVGVAAAFAGWDVWALVAQQMALAAIEAIVLWRGSDWRPRWHTDRQSARDLLGFSSLSAMAGVGSFLQMRVDALLIGLMFGPVAVGLYRMASRLTDMLIEATSGAMKSVSLPELSRIHGNRSPVAARFLELVRLATLASVPLLGVLFVVSAPLLNLLGTEWTPAIAALQLLCVAAVMQVPAGLMGPVLQAAGRPGVLAASAWVSAALSAGAFLAAGQIFADSAESIQLLGLAASRVVAIIILTVVIILPLLNRTVNVRPLDLIGATGRTTVGVAAGVLVVEALSTATGMDALSASSPFLALLMIGTASVPAIMAGVLMTEPRARLLVGKAIQTVRAHGTSPADLSSSRR